MSKRILIIDDEPNIRRMMRLTLEAAGYEVQEAEGGAQGLKLYENGTEWAVVVLDQRMPGIDGLETLRQLKSHDPGARVVLATAYASIELAVDAMKLGAADFVRKPMTPETLRNAVAAAIAKAASRPAVTTSPPEQPLIQTVTMNGFTIVDDAEAPQLEDNHRHFTVVSPQGETHNVLVEIDMEAIAYVRRMTNRRLAPAIPSGRSWLKSYCPIFFGITARCRHCDDWCSRIWIPTNSPLQRVGKPVLTTN